MTFQFLCPQGHLLQGDPSQMGQQCNCPMCGTPFIIPTVAQGAPEASGGGPFDFNLGPQPQQEGFSGVDPLGHLAPETPQAGPEVAVDFASEPTVYHIPCPNGHELETPEEMLDQEVLCPFCSQQFRLRRQDSVEYKKRKAEELERREMKAGKMWFNWAIVIAVIVVLGLVIMMAVTITNR